MPDKVTQVLRAREGGNVYRCHGIPHLDEYTVGKHTFDMLLLLDALHPAPTVDLFLAILRHDLHERYMGDIPGRIKVSLPALHKAWKEATALIVQELEDDSAARLSEEDRAWLDALDKLELLLWCHDQLAQGNKNVTRVLQDVENRLRNGAGIPQPVREFYDAFAWKRTNEMHPDR